MTKFKINDWAGNTMDTFRMTVQYKIAMEIPPQVFESFDDAEYFLAVVLDDAYETDRQEYFIVEA